VGGLGLGEHHAAAGGLDGLHGRLAGRVDVQGHGELDFTARQQLHAALLAAHEARTAEGGTVDGGAGLETLEVGEVDDLVGGADVVEPALRQAAITDCP